VPPVFTGRARATGDKSTVLDVVRVRRDWSRSSHVARACQTKVLLLAQRGNRDPVKSVEPLGIPPDADFSGIAPRDEDEIHDCQSETHWPPNGGHNQSVATGRNGVGGQ
jgi:hypothetical protein